MIFLKVLILIQKEITLRKPAIDHYLTAPFCDFFLDNQNIKFYISRNNTA